MDNNICIFAINRKYQTHQRGLKAKFARFENEAEFRHQEYSENQEFSASLKNEKQLQWSFGLSVFSWAAE